ncbi:hypothetical protein PR048_022779 [Dryococelus australis]|uniref:Uncharacterized protein n=1 Tax=Dryococelus australis TaxID=614101 RepID=A0ABQ9GSC4_9NEOP|nr:hypothetical protein PR048_022779 [Dryococelus australis]
MNISQSCAPITYSSVRKSVTPHLDSSQWRNDAGSTPYQPPRSPDVNPLDFCLCGHLKTFVYATSVDDVVTLRYRIVAGFETTRNFPGIHQRIRVSVQWRKSRATAASKLYLRPKRRGSPQPTVFQHMVLYALELASFLHWLLHRCEDTPSLTELHVIGAHDCGVFLYWCRVTQGVSHKDKIDFKRVYTEVTFAIVSEFTRNALEDPGSITDLQRLVGDGNASYSRVYRCFIKSLPRRPPFPSIPPLNITLPPLPHHTSSYTTPSPPHEQGEPGSIPGRVTRFSQVGMAPDDTVVWRIFSGTSLFPRPCIPVLLQSNLFSPSSALKTSLARRTPRHVTLTYNTTTYRRLLLEH